MVDNGGAPIAGNVVGGSNSTITFNNGAQIGGNVATGAGTQGTFRGAATIGGSVVGTGSTLAFNGPATIGQGVTGDVGSSFSFAGPTSIGQSVSGQSTSFVFSKGEATTIGGDVVLGRSSSLKGGTIATPIRILGAATVNSGSTLGGNLIVSGSLGGSGGTVSPGNSVGTQSYATSAGFVGAYKAEVNAAGQSDLIIIRSGNLDLSGIDLTVAQENGTGGYRLRQKYTIIQTPGGAVLNTFKSTGLDASFADTLVKLDPVLYGAQDVGVSLSIDPAKVAAKTSSLSMNQNATLGGVISVAGSNAAADAALVSTDTKGALNQLSGELHASTQSALLSSGDLMVSTLSNRMRGNLGVGLMAGAPLAQASGAVPASAMPQSAAYPLWAQVVGSWQTFKGRDNNTAKSRLATGGLYLGGDADVGAGWRVGGALGFTDGQVDVDDRSARSRLKSYTASVYGGKSWATGKGRINFLVGAGYTRHVIDSRRTVSMGGNQALEAKYHANATQLFTELGYALPVGQAGTIEPYVGLAWINQRSQGFDETGGAAALHGDSRTDSVTTMTLGVRGKTMVNVGRQTVRLTAGLGWRHAGGDVNPERRLAFLQGNGTAFTVSGAPIARNAAVVDLGAEMAIGKKAAVGMSYSGQFGAGNTDNAGSLYLRVRF
ncbi:autotransporter domain-containing protein [Paralcaligenes sp. KSB-10]|nr:autotransporter outer membrane beta-barrel domain-containing protein [Paralcaligenes sp. KSB-10]UHL66239.1 autotransporter domain-containing protein [Paralcaligenes sp. KSB-10]